jgi:DNA-binding XRE family transcriptional regulator
MNIKFTERLKELRKEKNLTQKQLSKLINVSEDCIYFWEKGRSEPSILDLINLSNVFEVSIDYLVGKTAI